MMRDRSESPRPSFRNTRSKFFKKKTVHQNQDKSHHEQSTGDYWKVKGNQQLKKGNIKFAIQNYTRAMEMNPGQSVYFSNRARCYKMQGRFLEALKDAEQASELQENNIKAHYLCGCILAELGKNDNTKLEKSQNRFKKALRLCSTLKQQAFQQTISIKLYRLRKLKFLVEEEKKLQFYHSQMKMIQTSYHEGIITKDVYEKMRNDFENFNKIVKKEIPDYMLCKITLQLMEEPVTTEAGHTYQKSAVEDHFQTNGPTQPISRKQIHGKLYQNLALKKGIQLYLEENPWAYEFSENQEYRGIQF